MPHFISTGKLKAKFDISEASEAASGYQENVQKYPPDGDTDVASVTAKLQQCKIGTTESNRDRSPINDFTVEQKRKSFCVQKIRDRSCRNLQTQESSHSGRGEKMNQANGKRSNRATVCKNVTEKYGRSQEMQQNNLLVGDKDNFQLLESPELPVSQYTDTAVTKLDSSSDSEEQKGLLERILQSRKTNNSATSRNEYRSNSSEDGTANVANKIKHCREILAYNVKHQSPHKKCNIENHASEMTHKEDTVVISSSEDTDTEDVSSTDLVSACAEKNAESGKALSCSDLKPISDNMCANKGNVLVDKHGDTSPEVQCCRLSNNRMKLDNSHISTIEIEEQKQTSSDQEILSNGYKRGRLETTNKNMFISKSFIEETTVDAKNRSVAEAPTLLLESPYNTSNDLFASYTEVQKNSSSVESSLLSCNVVDLPSGNPLAITPYYEAIPIDIRDILSRDSLHCSGVFKNAVESRLPSCDSSTLEITTLQKQVPTDVTRRLKSSKDVSVCSIESVQFENHQESCLQEDNTETGNNSKAAGKLLASAYNYFDCVEDSPLPLSERLRLKISQ